MIEFFKYLKGYLCIRVTGFSPERFMNLCSNREILLWNIRKDEDAYFMCLSVAGFLKLRPIVKKTGTKVVIVKKCGLPFLMSIMWKRKVFLLGFALSVLFWIWTSRYIWAIDIQGNFSITDDVVMDFLDENRVFIGMKKSGLDIEMLEKNIRKEFYQVTWTSAKLDGTKLTIQMKENELLEFETTDKEDALDDKEGSDLIAKRDGKIVSMIVREGVPQVTIGQDVKKGDVLVTGKVPVYQEDGTIRKYRYCKADADIKIEYDLSVSEPFSLFYEKKKYTGREKKQYYITLGEKNIRFGSDKMPFLSYDTVAKETQLQILTDFYLPIRFGNYTFREYYVKEMKYSKEEAKTILNQKYEKIMATLEEKGVQIIGKDVKIETNDSKWVLKGILRVQENAGESISIEEEFLEEETVEKGVSG